MTMSFYEFIECIGNLKSYDANFVFGPVRASYEWVLINYDKEIVVTCYIENDNQMQILRLLYLEEYGE